MRTAIRQDTTTTKRVHDELRGCAILDPDTVPTLPTRRTGTLDECARCDRPAKRLDRNGMCGGCA